MWLLLSVGLVIYALAVVQGARGDFVAAPVPLLTADDVLVVTNASRAHAGVSPLALDPRLTAAASHRLADMLQRHYFSHKTPEGTYVWDTLAEKHCAYRIAAENLARGFTNAGAMENLWMRSLPHRANILNARHTLIGIAVSQDPPMAVVLFADRCG
jgi:uncharacterized protein YkwD